jgi:hypothetical protein
MTQASRNDRDEERVLYCPSSRPEQEGALVFGLVVGTGDAPEVAYLDEPVPFSAELLKLADGLEPTEVFRATSRCAQSKCRHYSGSHCSLGERIVETRPVVTQTLPPCAIRSECRWFAEQRAQACVRCPQIVTDRPWVLREEPPVAASKSRRQLPVV